MTDQTPATPTAARPLAGRGYEAEIAAVGERLGRTLERVVELVPTTRRGPVALANTLQVDKVLTSRVLKALRQREPLAIAHHVPGPDPLRRLVRAAGETGVERAVLEEAEDAIEAFEVLIRDTAGDRSALDAIISAWLPDARLEFELRRKQAAFKAMSQLKGVAADLNFASVMLHPAAREHRADVVWLFGSLGVRRLRPGVPVKFTSRRFATEETPRMPRTLDGEPVDASAGIGGLRLDHYCTNPASRLEVQRVGEIVHYTLGDHGFGPRSAVDLVFAEVNFDEIDRYRTGPGRLAYFFAEVPIPVRTLVFDVLVHDEIYRGREPQLYIYDTVLEGVAGVNDRTRDFDRLDLDERVVPLGRGPARFRCAEMPRSVEMIREVCDRLGWDGERFRGYRCHIDYPVYGSQVTVAFDPPDAPPSIPGADSPTNGEAGRD